MYPIDFFWRAARRWPQRIAIDAPGGTITYASLAGDVAALAAALHTLDPTPQSRVAICAGNGAEHIIALLAVLASGKIWVPLNPRSTASEIGRIVDATEPSIVVVEDGYAQLVSCPAAHRIGFLAISHANEAEVARHDAAGFRLNELIAARKGVKAPRLDLPAEATQAIKFTGGTTGLPKGVMQTYRSWLTTIVNQIQTWEFDEHDRYVVAAPITHGTGTYLLPILAQGGCHVILAEAGAQAVRNAFRERGGTVCFAPPTLIYMLMALPHATRDDFPRLRRLIYGGAPMPLHKIEEAGNFFGPVLGTTYGQTEAPQILTAMRPEDFDDPLRRASVGRTTWLSDVAIMAPDGNFLPEGEVGEVVARGDLLMTGYWRLPEKTAETLIDGWLHTGDRGYLDAGGYLYLKDRLRDLVITGGFNVYPVDVENAIQQHPAVHESSVFGVPDDKWGEAVHAAVQLRVNAAVTEAELAAFVRELLGPVHTPKRIHFFTDLPRSPVGKVLKSAVRDLALGNAGSTTTI